MKRLFFAICICLLIATSSHAFFIRFFTSLTGDVAGSIDNVTCDDVYGTEPSTSDGVGVVITSAGDVYFYYYDQSATDATSSPDYIRCKDYATSGVWILASSVGGGFISGSDCSGITSGICLDTDNGKLYSWDGDSVELVGVLDWQPLEATLTDIADGTITEDLVNTANPWAVNEGGTGAATFTDGGILLGSGTDAITALGQATNGQIPIGSTGSDPVLANITEETDALVVTNGAGTIVLSAHDNLEALADAGANFDIDTDGVINPTDAPAVTGHHDTDAEDVFQIKMANKAATESDTEYYGFTGNALSLWGTHDGGNDEFNFSVPVKAPSIDGGVKFQLIVAAYSIQSSLPNQCEMVIYANGQTGDIAVTLPNEPLCGTAPVTGSNPMSSKYFRVQNVDTDAADNITLTPGSGDEIFYNGTGCGAGDTLSCDSNPSMFDIYGYDAGSGDFWIVMPLVGTCTCD